MLRAILRGLDRLFRPRVKSETALPHFPWNGLRTDLGPFLFTRTILHRTLIVLKPTLKTGIVVTQGGCP